jgi:GxxExxY protein
MDLLQINEPVFKKESYEIIGACMEVHKTLGCGFPEAIYQEALEIELVIQNIPFLSQSPLKVFYKGHKLKKEFIPDFIVFDKIIVELKAAEKLTDENIHQVLNYLKATDFKLAILVNFGTKSLQYKRIVV